MFSEEQAEKDNCLVKTPYGIGKLLNWGVDNGFGSIGYRIKLTDNSSCPDKIILWLNKELIKNLEVEYA